MFGGILEVSGGAQRIAETLIGKFGQKKAGWALGLTGLVIGTTVFFEAGVVVLIPLVFSVAKQTKNLHCIIQSHFFQVWQVDMRLSHRLQDRTCGKCTWCESGNHDHGRSSNSTDLYDGFRNLLGSFIGNKIHTELPANVEEIKDDGKELPPFGLVLGVILIPLVLILLSTLSKYMPLPAGVQDVLGFIGKPFLALTIATLASMYFSGN